MKAPTEVSFASSFDKTGVVSLTSKTATIIYCCIRNSHIVDGDFDAQVAVFAESLDANLPEFYLDFKKRLSVTPLNDFGRRTIREFGFRRETIPDDNFWIGVWEYINGWKDLAITFETKD